MRFSRSLAACAAAALIVTLAACTDTSSSGDDEVVDTPLTPYYEALYGGGDDMEQLMKKQDEEQKEIEEKVAACMTEQGFEYTAYMPETQGGMEMEISDDEDNVWDPEDKAWVEKWGYGAVDWPGREEDEQAQEEPAEETGNDPNLTYYESLTDGEKAAYDEALSGPPLDEEAYTDEDYEYRWEDGGCYGAAMHEVQGDGDEDELSEFEDLIARMDGLWEELANDPEIVALDAAWSSCMADAGHAGFDVQQDAQNSIYEELDELTPDAEEPAQGEPTTEDDTAEMPDMSPEGNPEVAALQEREIELALADLECREKTSYWDEWQKISNAREQEFVDENKVELDAMKLAAEQAR